MVFLTEPARSHGDNRSNKSLTTKPNKYLSFFLSACPPANIHRREEASLSLEK